MRQSMMVSADDPKISLANKEIPENNVKIL